MGTLKYAATPTLTPSKDWINSSDAERKKTINYYLSVNGLFAKVVGIVSTHDDGQVILSLKNTISASERGTLLFDIEEMLKDKYDHGITVWLEPLGDRNSLRNLRGVEIK